MKLGREKIKWRKKLRKFYPNGQVLDVIGANHISIFFNNSYKLIKTNKQISSMFSAYSPT